MSLRNLTLLALAIGLTACGTVGGPEGGVATLDSLKRAEDECVAKGGHLVLQKNGDPQFIGDYTCEGGSK
jgi:hypothetical protein